VILVEGKEKKISYAVFTFGNTSAVTFVLLAQAKDFEAFQPRFDAMLIPTKRMNGHRRYQVGTRSHRVPNIVP